MLLSELNMEIPHVPRLSNEYAELFFHWFEWLKADCHAGDLRNMAKSERRIPQTDLQWVVLSPEIVRISGAVHPELRPAICRMVSGDFEIQFRLKGIFG